MLPIGPFKSFPHVQLMKITMPIAVSISGGGPTQQFSVTGVGDLQFFDLLTFKQSWGRWGVGPALSESGGHEQRSTTVIDPSSEGMLSRTRRGVPNRGERRCDDSEKEEETS